METLVDCIVRHADHQPDKVFWRHLGPADVVEITFRGLYDRARSFAHAYSPHVRRGDVVLIFLPHHPDAPAAFFGAMLLGAVPSFMPCPSAKQHPSTYWPAHLKLLQRIRAKVLLTDAVHARQMKEHGLADAVDAIIDVQQVGHNAEPLPPVAIEEGATALLQHSSGTTGLKKGVALSHAAILKQVEAYAPRLGAGTNDNIVSWLPLYHDMGLIACTVQPLVLGQTVTTLDPFRWVSRPPILFDAIDRYDGHFVWLPNFAFEHLVRTTPQSYKADLSRVKAFVNCSEACRPETFERFQERFAGIGVDRRQLQVCYAMAETVFAVSQTEPGRPPAVITVDLAKLQSEGVATAPSQGGGERALISTGPPLPGIEVRIRAQGRDLPDNAVGEVVLRGDFLFSGYFNDPDTTAERMTEAGYHSRDQGFLRDGELFILGRTDDLVIVNGRNLHAHEVEAVVGSVEGLRPGRVAAFGLANDSTGSDELVIVAERAQGQDPSADEKLTRTIRDMVYDHTNIEISSCRIVEPEWLVKTTSGKMSRRSNKEKYLSELRFDGPARLAQEKGASPTLQRLAAMIGEQFRYPASRVSRQTVAQDVDGWNSLAQSTLIIEIEAAFKVRFQDEEMFGFANVGALADRIDELLAGGEQSVSERIVHQSSASSIVAFGKDTGQFEFVCFAGKQKRFGGGLAAMDFSSVFLDTGARDSRKFFVTDRAVDWYTTAFDELADRLRTVSDRPKVLMGNSMGGYGALRFAEEIPNTIGVLTFVPRFPNKKVVSAAERPPPKHFRLRDDIPYCILMGQAEDEEEKAYLQERLGEKHRMLIVPNCGHNLVDYLHHHGYLAAVLDCCLRPKTMIEDIAKIVASIDVDPEALRRREERRTLRQDRRLERQNRRSRKLERLL